MWNACNETKKIMESDGIQLPDGETIKIAEQDGYKYLGILELDKIMEAEMRECVQRNMRGN